MITGLASPDVYDKAIDRGLTPDPIQTISEWADGNMILPGWVAEPGPWRTDRTPYLRRIMDCLSPSSPVRRVVFMKCAQIGGTEVLKNWAGFTIARSPASMLLVEPTVDMAKKLSKQKLKSMLDDVAALRGKVRDARERDAGNTILEKEFEGGLLVLTGANSGVGLRFMSAQNLGLDEVDAYPFDVDGEGHPISVAENRTTTYARYKIYLCSTPLEKATSIIEPEYESSSKERYHLPCPYCDHGQPLVWAQLKWPEGKPEEAAYECAQCRKLIPEHRKTWMLEQGAWVSERPEVLDTVGFHINALYTPNGWVNSWPKLAKEWVEIIHKKDMRKQKTFTNTKLAETWTEEGESFDGFSIRDRREVYPAQVPDGVLVITAAVDVQDDRFECEVKGWGLGEETWSLDYRVIYANPALIGEWKAVTALLQETFTHESGLAMRIVAAAIDTGGHHTKTAYEFVKNTGGRVFAVKGSNQPGQAIVSPPTKKNIAKVNLFMVGTDTAKDTIFSRMKLTEPGPGCMHFPEHYTEEYFDQLTAEARYPKFVKGVQVGTYYKKERARNEALDLTVYNMAAFTILNPNLEAIARNIEGQISAAQKGTGQEAKKGTPVRKRGNYINRWRSGL